MSWRFPYYNETANLIDWDSIGMFDWFKDMDKVSQDKIWDAEGNVQTHTKMVCEVLIALPEFQELDDQDKHIMVTAVLVFVIHKDGFMSYTYYIPDWEGGFDYDEPHVVKWVPYDVLTSGSFVDITN